MEEHIEGDGETIFRHACKLGLEGIVSKREDIALPLGSLTRLAEVQEPGRACYLKRRPSRRRGMLLNGKEADLKQSSVKNSVSGRF
jgi:hypothetical protein